MPFEFDFCNKRDNICQKITNFVSETIPQIVGVRTQVGSWPNVLHSWQSRNLGKQERLLGNS